MNFKLTIENEADHETLRVISDGLINFNQAIVGPDHYQPLNIVARSEQGEVVGGLIAATYWQWLHVDILWLREDVRGQGRGQAVLKMAEDEARLRGCTRVHLDTLDFQAPLFYQRLGYTIFGQLDNFLPAHTRYYLTKAL